MFSIEDSGDILLGDLSDLNTSTAHLVAVATDTGIPPRQVSEPFFCTHIYVYKYETLCIFCYLGFSACNCSFARYCCEVCWPNNRQ